MKKFNVYVKVGNKTQKYQVDHSWHVGAIGMVRNQVKRQKHGAILAVEVV